MTRIDSNKFNKDFQSGIDIDNLSEEAKATLKNTGIDLAKIDLDKDGKIDGEKELKGLFKAIDKFDQNGSSRSFETRLTGDPNVENIPTVSGLLYETLKSELNRNLDKARIQGPGKKDAHLNDANTIGRQYVLDLSKKSQEELVTWFDAAPEELKDAVKSRIAEIDARELPKSDLASMNKLTSTLNQLQTVDHYSGRKSEDIAKEFVQRVVDGTNVEGTRVIGERGAIKEIVEDLKLLAESKDPKSRDTYMKAFEGFQKALRHTQQNRFMEGGRIRTIPEDDVITHLETLSGPGSAVVKADMIKTMLSDKSAEKSTVGVERLLRSDPSGVVGELKHSDDNNLKDPPLLDRALTTIAKTYADDPNKAAAVVREILASVAKDYMNATQKEPQNHKKIAELGRNLSYLFRGAEKMVGALASKEKAKIDNGASIADVFITGVSIEVPSLELAGAAFIEYQTRGEYEIVEQWKQNVLDSYKMILKNARLDE